MSFAHPIKAATKDQTQNPVLFILLGASNLSRSFHGLKYCIKRCIFPRPAIFLHAMGPGRGYISGGGILNVVYSPILESGIFEVSRRKRIENQQVVALITDIGNDIMYDISSEKIIGGLQYLFNILGEFESNIFITSIPVDLENDVNELLFYIIRQVYFPKSPIKYSQALNSVKAINTFILKSSNQNISVINDLKPFCGIDKIHYSIFKSKSAWSHITKKLTADLGVNSLPKLKTSEVALSITSNIARVLLTDMLGIVHKTEETF